VGPIFISHSGHDNDRARGVRDWLFANGWRDVFLDLDPVPGLALAADRGCSIRRITPLDADAGPRLSRAGRRCIVVGLGRHVLSTSGVQEELTCRSRRWPDAWKSWRKR
jgi:hypothetical protein